MDAPSGGRDAGRPGDDEHGRHPRGSGPTGGAAPVVRVAVAGLAVEVLVLAAVAVLYLVGTARGAAASAGLALGSAVLALALAGLLAGSAVGMVRGRRRGRAPALVWQVLQLLVAAQVVLEERTGSSTWWAALGVAALAAVVGLALGSGAATRALPVAADGDERLL